MKKVGINYRSKLETALVEGERLEIKIDRMTQNMIDRKKGSKYEAKKIMFILSIVEEYNEEIETQDFSKKIIRVGAIEP